MPTTPRHLVSVWNPAYAVDAMDAHVNVLVERARVHRKGALANEDEAQVSVQTTPAAREVQKLRNPADHAEPVSREEGG